MENLTLGTCECPFVSFCTGTSGRSACHGNVVLNTKYLLFIGCKPVPMQSVRRRPQQFWDAKFEMFHLQTGKCCKKCRTLGRCISIISRFFVLYEVWILDVSVFVRGMGFVSKNPYNSIRDFVRPCPNIGLVCGRRGSALLSRMLELPVVRSGCSSQRRW